MKTRAAIFGLLLSLVGSFSALAQTSPNWTTRYVPTAAEWNALFASKQDFPNTNVASFAATSPVAVTFPGGIVTYACPTCADTASPLSQFAATTSAQLRGVLSDETGTGLAVFNNTPTLITPILGVAAATSINKVAITAPATSATLTIPDGVTLTGPAASGTVATLAGSEALTNKSYNGNTWTAGTGVLTISAGKTFAVSNTLTLSGTDGSTLNVGAGGTLGSNAFNSTTYAPLASPSFTGTPLAPTASVSTNNTQIATTAFVFANTCTTTCVTSAASLTSGSLMVGSGLQASAVTATGTGVVAALGVSTGSAGAFSVLIASGATALGTSAISSATCATVVTATATGAATTDVLTASFNSDPTSTTGYQASASGMLTIIQYLTTNTANFKVCNNTLSSITPGAITANWRVVR